jgi:hypothetical protein
MCSTVSVLLWNRWPGSSFKTPFGKRAAGSVGITADCVTGAIDLRLKMLECCQICGDGAALCRLWECSGVLQTVGMERCAADWECSGVMQTVGMQRCAADCGM